MRLSAFGSLARTCSEAGDVMLNVDSTLKLTMWRSSPMVTRSHNAFLSRLLTNRRECPILGVPKATVIGMKLPKRSVLNDLLPGTSSMPLTAVRKPATVLGVP